MSTKYSKQTLNIINIFLSIASSLCLTGLILFNLTFFYENKPQQGIIIFTIVLSVLFILIFFANKAFVLPYIERLKEWKSLGFIALMVLILTIAISVSAKHYWEIPVIHQVEICFDAEEEFGNLIIDEMVDPNTNRRYSPASFGSRRYPLTINSGGCINGELVNLVRRTPRWWIVPRVKFLIFTRPPDGRFFITVNDVPSVLIIDRDAEELFNGEIIVNEGFDQGTQTKVPWRKAWFFALKAGGVFFSGIYLSIFFFGLTERIIVHPDDEMLRLEN